MGILTVAEVEQLKNNKDGICDVVNLFSFFLAFWQSFAVFVGLKREGDFLKCLCSYYLHFLNGKHGTHI